MVVTAASKPICLSQLVTKDRGFFSSAGRAGTLLSALPVPTQFESFLDSSKSTPSARYSRSIGLGHSKLRMFSS